MRFLIAMVSAAAAAIVTPAFGHGTSTVQVSVINDNGTLKVTSGTDVDGLKVIADNAEVFNSSGQTTVPGWSFDAALNSSTIQLKVLDTLLYWTPADGLSATTSDNLALRRLFFPIPTPGPDSATVGQSSISDPVTLLWDSSTVGQSHHIMRYEVPAASPSGAYGVLVGLEDVNNVLAPSDPFLLVFNKGLTNTPVSQPGQALDQSQFGQALLAMTNELNADADPEAVPEPTTIALMAFAGLAAIPILRNISRRNRGK